ncbi:hypothetical protein F9948_25320 [Burkholderia thailandensis]|nr:hypothetical protein [Burkholderia thailandensis]MDD1489574.1 hypothetical protein [Burkholderia thailandensis]MDD1495648.1 hypothetical protein [Burkholderia thailandensis]
MRWHAGRSRYSGCSACVQRVFGRRSAMRSANVRRKARRMRSGCAEENAPAMPARPNARRTRGAPRFGAMRRDGRIARAQPTACAGK